MDFLSHVIFVTSLKEPSVPLIIGSVVGDISMIKRRPTPDPVYRVCHSGLAIVIAFLINTDFGIGLSSHIFLDLFTHGSSFSPRLFYPINDFHFSRFKEWEFFNSSFFIGLLIILLSWLLRISIGSPWLPVALSMVFPT